MLMLMSTSVCDEEGEDDDVVVDVDDYVNFDVHFDDIALSRGGFQIMLLESPCVLSWKKDRMEGRFIKLCIAKTKPSIFIFIYFTREVKA